MIPPGGHFLFANERAQDAFMVATDVALPADAIENNHPSSKGGSAQILGTEQPVEARREDASVNGSLDERRARAKAVAAFVDELPDSNEGARVIVLGDMNEFEFVSPVRDILGARLTDADRGLDEN